MSDKLFKISEATLAIVGVKDADSFFKTLADNSVAMTKGLTTLDEFKATIGTEVTKAVTEGMKGVNASIGELATTVAGHTKSLGNPELLTEAKIREIATTAGSSEAAKALGATGATPPAPPSAAAKAADANASQALLKAGKYAEAFASNANWQAEFGTVEVFTAFFQAQRGGHVKLRE